MNLTQEQQTICQAARDLGVQSSLKIQAFAGTGKTTTLVDIAKARKFLYLVFNRAAAEEADLKMPANVSARTAHAIAFRSVGYIY
jgi:F-box protein 18 (helicase)